MSKLKEEAIKENEKSLSNQEINKKFLTSIDDKTRQEILSCVEKNYGISAEEALNELTDESSEHLLDYLTGEIRVATSVLMKRHNFTPDKEMQSEQNEHEHKIINNYPNCA